MNVVYCELCKVRVNHRHFSTVASLFYKETCKKTTWFTHLLALLVSSFRINIKTQVLKMICVPGIRAVYILPKLLSLLLKNTLLSSIGYQRQLLTQCSDMTLFNASSRLYLLLVLQNCHISRCSVCQSYTNRFSTIQLLPQNSLYHHASFFY